MGDELSSLLEDVIQIMRRAKRKLDMLYSDFAKSSITSGRKLLFFETLNDIDEALKLLSTVRRKLNDLS